jgi:hypothetical protein
MTGLLHAFMSYSLQALTALCNRLTVIGMTCNNLVDDARIRGLV